jgi:type II secretory pathway pseudopilin PulG
MTLPPRRAAGFTLVEMLTTVAVLIILLGLMVSLARHVRLSASDQLTREILHRLDQAMAIYVHLNNDTLPNVPTFIDDSHGLPTEAALQGTAAINNRTFVRILNSDGLLSSRVSDLSIANYDQVYVRDAWGSPIVFMAHMHPAVGMDAKGWFFFSAGPDGRYLTRDDNLYSYDQRPSQP